MTTAEAAELLCAQIQMTAAARAERDAIRAVAFELAAYGRTLLLQLKAGDRRHQRVLDEYRSFRESSLMFVTSDAAHCPEKDSEKSAVTLKARRSLASVASEEAKRSLAENASEKRPSA